ncbi:GNAT family N-acetyltransferase [Clostridium sp. D2Q-14]|uniref:GNAT family N-acetyltransferase n=1 Tax=Anaeromonas gelatinilytica TaxID=2683194 RepID=UPI00193B5B80|nr:GNAT family N-acetyltransferase [Anaeromonas gelatinilytica]MBS4535305.1 GNAT family N-acetyltransferase [Anaeromonas gelatinilytica]
MKKIEDKNKIKGLLEEDKIFTSNILGRMKYEKGYNIFVDDVDNINGVLLKSGNWYLVYSPEDKIAKKLINNLKGNKLNFAGVPIEYYNFIKESKEIDWEEICHLYYIDSNEFELLKPNHKVSNLRMKDAEIVNEFYTYKSENSIDYIKNCIAERKTSCIFDKNGKPLSWAVIREDGSMGIMYTRKEYRNKGLAISVTLDLINKVINNGDTPFVHIVHGNTPSVRLAEYIGFKKHGDIAWFGTKDI